MKIRKAFKKLTQGEPYIDLDVFLDTYETFEEFPLISRYRKLSHLQKMPQAVEVSSILLNISFFILNSASMYIRSNGYEPESRFIAITYTDFDFTNKTEPPIPNFFINSNSTMTSFTKKLKSKKRQEKSSEIHLVEKQFESCGLSCLFTFYESRFFDSACNEEFVRVYAIRN